MDFSVKLKGYIYDTSFISRVFASDLVRSSKYVLRSRLVIWHLPVGRSHKQHINEEWADLIGDGCPGHF